MHLRFVGFGEMLWQKSERIPASSQSFTQFFTNFACPFLSRSKIIEDIVTVRSGFSKFQSVLHSEAL